MLIATTTVLHRVFTFDQTLNTTIVSGISLTAFMTLFIAWHCITDEIIMHSVLFGVMIALIGIKTRSIIARRVQDKVVRKEVFKLCTWGGGKFPVPFQFVFEFWGRGVLNGK
jgi:dihydroceramidase